MNHILCIDTATDICSVALAENGICKDTLEAKEERSHARWLSVLIRDLLEKNSLKTADLSAVAVSEGPGSYTGLRIGVSAAKGICYATGIPLIAISTLQTLAAAYIAQNSELPSNAIIIPMLDARRMEIYYARYTKMLEELTPATPHIVTQDSFSNLKNENNVAFIGSGAAKSRTIINLPNAHFDNEVRQTAQYMTLIAQEKLNQKKFADVAYFEPAYLKPFIATKPKKNIL